MIKFIFILLLFSCNKQECNSQSYFSNNKKLKNNHTKRSTTNIEENIKTKINTESLFYYYCLNQDKIPEENLKSVSSVLKSIKIINDCKKAYIKLSEIKSLKINDITFNETSTISEFKNIKSMDFSNTSIESFISFENMNDITSLKLKNNNLNSWIGFEKIHNIEILNLYNCEITNFYDLAINNEYNLKILNLSSNNIVTLEGIEKFSNLRELNISNNINLTDYEPLLKLSYLEILNVSNQRIGNIDNLIKMKNIKVIDVTDSKWNISIKVPKGVTIVKGY